jgi:hypothetical protein
MALWCLVEIDLVSRQAGDAVSFKDHLWGEIDRMNLADLFRSEHVDHIFGDEFSYLTDPGQSLNQDGIYEVFILETVKIVDADVIDHFAILRYFP